jgi:6-phosphogluconolactonase/glucosamine-6-phosphate isomerase/deaminase
MLRELEAGKVKILIEKDESAMGKRSAELMAKALEDASRAGKKTVLWLMAAPSGFAFYRAFTDLCKSDEELADVMRKTLFYQFDDYPIGRDDPKFAITHRYLLEKNFFDPLSWICGPSLPIMPLELKGDEEDDEAARTYAQRMCDLLDDPSYFVAELKGIGMDGHWGFHDSGTPLETKPGIIKVPLKGQNIHQQKLDWPQYFKTDADVPQTAYSFTAAAFMKADYIIDNVPQASKKYSVLAVYGNEMILGETPSSILKKHPHAQAVLTADSADILAEFSEACTQTGSHKLSRAMYKRLAALWANPLNPEQQQENVRVMDQVLEKLGFI